MENNNNRISFVGRLISRPQVKEVTTTNGQKTVVSMFIAYYDSVLKTKTKCNVSLFFDTDKSFLYNKFLGDFKQHEVAILDAKRNEARSNLDQNGNEQEIQQFVAYNAMIGQKIEFNNNSNSVTENTNEEYNLTAEDLPF